MNFGLAMSRADYKRLLVNQSGSSPAADPVYHPMLVGPEFFNQRGATMMASGLSEG